MPDFAWTDGCAGQSGLSFSTPGAPVAGLVSGVDRGSELEVVAGSGGRLLNLLSNFGLWNG